MKQKNKHTSPTAAEQGPRLICSANSKAPAQGTPLPPPAGASFFGEFLTSDNSLLLILRRLDEIERPYGWPAPGVEKSPKRRQP